MSDMNDPHLAATVDHHEKRINDHETRLRTQERWAVNHEARYMEQHRATGRLVEAQLDTDDA